MSFLRRLGMSLRQRQRWLLIALLGLLHLALVADPSTRFGLLCWLVDVGLFILWQPFIYAERTVDFGGLTVIANAPNPAGVGILQEAKVFEGEGISPLGLFLGALPPTAVAIVFFWLLH